MFTQQLNTAYTKALQGEGGRLSQAITMLVQAHTLGEDLNIAQARSQGLRNTSAGELIRLAKELNEEVDEYLGSH